MKALAYKGYAARVEFDPEDALLTGRIAGISDIVGFYADTVPDLIAAFHEAVDDYLDACAKAGKEPQKAYSGNLMLRIPPQVHAMTAAAADASGKSLNQWSEEVLADAARKVMGG
jgi:predicted HicB family RNase H-like nuclease